MALKRGVAEEEDVMKKKFKPIVEPITELVKDIKTKKNKLKGVKQELDMKYEDDGNEFKNKTEYLKHFNVRGVTNKAGNEQNETDDDDDSMVSDENESIDSDHEDVSIDSYLKKKYV